MIRNLKALGLALVAIFAMSAMAASSASAQSEQGELTVEGGGTTTLDITELGKEENALTAFGQKVECPGSIYTGHKVLTEKETETKKHERIPNLSTTATITPHYKQEKSNCRATGNLPATITMNGCDYVFHIGKTTPAGNKLGTYGVSADIVCPPGKDIEVHIYAGTSHLVTLCTLTITPQNDLTGPHLTNTPAGTWPKDDLHIKGTFTNIHVHRTGGCVTEDVTTTTTGEFHINATIEGTTEAKTAQGITITDTI